MQRKPQAKSQAEILARELAAAGIELKHQKALEIVAKIHGFKGWNEMSKSAASDLAQPSANTLFEVLAKKAKEVVDAADDTGCSDDLTVTSSGAVQELSDLLETIDLPYSNNPMLRFNPKSQIAIIWDAYDVQSVCRPDLTEAEALEVLQKTNRQHDASLGVTWDILSSTADWMFKERVVPCVLHFPDSRSVNAILNLASGEVSSDDVEKVDVPLTGEISMEPLGDIRLPIIHGLLFGGDKEELLKITEQLDEAGQLPELIQA